MPAPTPPLPRVLLLALLFGALLLVSCGRELVLAVERQPRGARSPAA